jgi:hypothetical protein
LITVLRAILFRRLYHESTCYYYMRGPRSHVIRFVLSMFTWTDQFFTDEQPSFSCDTWLWKLYYLLVELLAFLVRPDPFTFNKKSELDRVFLLEHSSFFQAFRKVLSSIFFSEGNYDNNFSVALFTQFCLLITNIFTGFEVLFFLFFLLFINVITFSRMTKKW